MKTIEICPHLWKLKDFGSFCCFFDGSSLESLEVFENSDPFFFRFGESAGRGGAPPPGKAGESRGDPPPPPRAKRVFLLCVGILDLEAFWI